MHPHQLEGLLAIFALFVLPSAAICTRIIVGAIVRLRGTQLPPPQPDTAGLQARVEALEDELRQLSESFDRVAAAAEFDAQLRSGVTAGAPSRLPPAAATVGAPGA